MSRHLGEIRKVLSARLRERQAEIEEAASTRVHAVADPAEATDPGYAEALRAAISAAVEYGIEAVETGGERSQSPPPLLLTQARIAARSGVSLDTVLRRYFVGYTLLGDFLLEEAEERRFMDGGELKRLLRVQASLFDQLLAAVSDEYSREVNSTFVPRGHRQMERVERLLAGELVDTSELPYDLEGWHLGVVAVGPRAAEFARELARDLDHRALVVSRDECTAWAWLGTRHRAEPAAAQRVVSRDWPDDVVLSLGEPGRGLGGWRLTHRQAVAALTIAQRSEAGPVRYADVALLASVARDDLLVGSLTDLYITPLAQNRDKGKTLRETLRAYFTAERNAASAAAALGVSRQAVNGRLRIIEELLGRPLNSCVAEMEIALKLEELK